MLHIELLEEEVPLSGTVLTQQVKREYGESALSWGHGFGLHNLTYSEALQLTFSLEEDGLTHPNPRLAELSVL